MKGEGHMISHFVFRRDHWLLITLKGANRPGRYKYKFELNQIIQSKLTFYLEKFSFKNFKVGIQ